MSIKLYERVDRFKEDLYRNAFRYAGTVAGVALGLYATKDIDNFMIIVVGCFVPAVLGNIIGGYIDNGRQGTR